MDLADYHPREPSHVESLNASADWDGCGSDRNGSGGDPAPELDLAERDFAHIGNALLQLRRHKDGCGQVPMVA